MFPTKVNNTISHRHVLQTLHLRVAVVDPPSLLVLQRFALRFKTFFLRLGPSSSSTLCFSFTTYSTSFTKSSYHLLNSRAEQSRCPLTAIIVYGTSINRIIFCRLRKLCSRFYDAETRWELHSRSQSQLALPQKYPHQIATRPPAALEMEFCTPCTHIS